MAGTNHSTFRFADQGSGLRSAARLVGSWIRDAPLQGFSGSILICLEVAMILTIAGLVHGLQADPSFVRVRFTLYTTMLLLFASAIGFLFLAIERYFNVIDKTQEYGILRVLGASSDYFFKILLCETLVIAVPGAVAGIVLSFWIRLGVGLVYPKFLRMDVLILWWPIALGIAAMESMIGGAIGIRKAVRDGVIQALSYEK
jgi:ABC-type antimicrobial peptide transport system permease subunit